MALGLAFHTVLRFFDRGTARNLSIENLAAVAVIGDRAHSADVALGELAV